jgi:lycopene elongase/hydratase (dihydrobisanhydrobacterioruberin-forming)
MPAALRILIDVAVFRFRRFEMANVAGVAAIAATLRLSAGEVFARAGFAVVLNLLVYLINDCCDLALDIQTASRSADKTRFLVANASHAIAVQRGLLVILTGVGLLWNPDLLAPLFAGAGICWAYSKWLKRMPCLDVFAMVGWGAAMAMAGTPLDNQVGWCLVFQLGLFAGVFECIQVLRDRHEDHVLGVRTTAVAMGTTGAIWFLRAMILASSVYGSVVLHPFAGAGILLLALVPFREGTARRYWHAARLILGLTFLFECGFVYATGASVDRS